MERNIYIYLTNGTTIVLPGTEGIILKVSNGFESMGIRSFQDDAKRLVWINFEHVTHIIY